MRKRHEKIFILSLALVLLKTIEFEDHFSHSPFCATKTRTRTPPIPSLPPTCEHSAASSWKDPPTKAQYSLVVILHCPRIPMQQGWPMISQIMCSAAWEVRLRPPEGKREIRKTSLKNVITSVSLDHIGKIAYMEFFCPHFVCLTFHTIFENKKSAKSDCFFFFI